jgi:hypothetical protein
MQTLFGEKEFRYVSGKELIDMKNQLTEILK